MKDKKLETIILYNSVLTPLTIIPGSVGAILLILSMVMGPIVGFSGFCSLMFSFGVACWNVFIDHENIKKESLQQFLQQERKKREQRLNSLDRKLIKNNKNSQDRECLRDLRQIYNEFQNDIMEGKVDVSLNATLIGHVEEIFEQCVNQLEKSYDVFKYANSKGISQQLKDKYNSQWTQIIEVVRDTINKLVEVIGQVKLMSFDTNVQTLQNLNKHLIMQLETAKRVEERLNLTDADLERFSEYAQE